MKRKTETGRINLAIVRYNTCNERLGEERSDEHKVFSYIDKRRKAEK